MNLPELPKQHKKKEADFGIDIKHKTEEIRPSTHSLELKHTRGKDSLPFSEVTDDQIAFANSISSDKGAWIRVIGLRGEPDYIWLKNEPAYIVIKYPLGIVYITIANFLHEKETSKRKSLTWDRACEIGKLSTQF
jgi:hypothetical protein